MAKKSAAQQLLAFAKQRGATCKTWIDLHNAVYGIGGKFGELMPKQSERAAFVKTPEFQQVADLIAALPRNPVDPPADEPSGKFVVRLPASLHAALLAEAKRENVSLNQLCVAKLASQLRAVV